MISLTRGACQSFAGWKASGSTGKGGLGPYYVPQFMREQSLPPLGPLTPAQVVCLLGLLVAGALLLLGLARARRTRLQRRGLPPAAAD